MSFNPVPKSASLHGWSSKTKKKPKFIGKGKKTKDWDKERARLKKRFKEIEITTCEVRISDNCTDDNFLGFAHPDKRRFLSKEDLSVVVLSCNNCHSLLEVMPRVKMKKKVLKIIKNRFLT